MLVQVDVTKVAKRMIDSLNMTQEQWQRMDDDGWAPEGWSDALLDNLTAVYDIEGDVIREMIELQNAQQGSQGEDARR